VAVPLGIVLVWLGYSIGYYGYNRITGGNDKFVSLVYPGQYKATKLDGAGATPQPSAAAPPAPKAPPPSAPSVPGQPPATPNPAAGPGGPSTVPFFPPGSS
jgi:hypothetical protein